MDLFLGKDTGLNGGICECEHLCGCLFNSTLVMHWRGFGYLDRAKESKKLLLDRFLGEPWVITKWYQSKALFGIAIVTWE